jgi:hypothetical protein
MWTDYSGQVSALFCMCYSLGTFIAHHLLDFLEKGIIFSRYWFKSVIRNSRHLYLNQEKEQPICNLEMSQLLHVISSQIKTHPLVDLFMQDILKQALGHHFMQSLIFLSISAIGLYVMQIATFQALGPVYLSVKLENSPWASIS